MNNYKKTARIVGILYIIGTAAGIASVPFLNLYSLPDYLVEIGNNPTSLQIGALLELVMGFSLAMIPAFMFPILKKYSETSGVLYVIFRGAVESCTYIIQAVCFLALSAISAEYVAGDYKTQTIIIF
jgi:hypothetical protein